MNLNVGKELAALQRLSVKELRDRYAEAFGEGTNANNRAWLIERIAWRLQALAEGDLSERARRRAAELANDADLRLSPPVVREPKPTTAEHSAANPTVADGTGAQVLPLRAAHHVPPPGAIIARLYKGEVLQVRVLDHGFEFEGTVYRSLSAVAKKITGGHCNGHAFFRLGKEAIR